MNFAERPNDRWCISRYAGSWYDWPVYNVPYLVDPSWTKRKPIPFYTITVPYPGWPDARYVSSAPFGNAINLHSRIPLGYWVGARLAERINGVWDFAACGGAAAYRYFADVLDRVPWYDGHQVPRRRENLFAGYRDPAIVESYL